MTRNDELREKVRCRVEAWSAPCPSADQSWLARDNRLRVPPGEGRDRLRLRDRFRVACRDFFRWLAR